MRTSSFNAGNHVHFDGVTHRIAACETDGRVQLVDDESGTFTTTTLTALHDRYSAKTLVFVKVHEEKDGKRPLEYQSDPLFAMSPNDQTRVTKKREFTQEMAARRFPGWHHRPEQRDESDKKLPTAFEIALAETSAKLGFTRMIVPSTYYKWCATYAEHEDAAAWRGHYRGHCQIDERARTIIRDTMQKLVTDVRWADPKKPVKPLTPKEIENKCREKIAEKNKENRLALQTYHPGRDEKTLSPIPIPISPTTYRRYWDQIPAYDRSLVQKGRSATREAFRGGRGAPQEEFVFDRTEYDETKLPFWAIHEGLGICLGRPWLSWHIEAVSGLPTGFYLGFEQVSDLSLTSALRSACLPKGYLQTEFRLGEPYPVSGIPRMMVFDNPLSQHARTVRTISTDLNNDYQFAPIETGWFKSLVEGSFHILNLGLLREMPGFVMKGVKARDYDPTREACIGFRTLLELIWVWIVYVHARSEHPRFKESRIDVYKYHAAKHQPSLLLRQDDADRIFSVVRDGKLTYALDHNGIEFLDLRYYSEEVDIMRHQFGAKGRVWVRINPADLETIFFSFRPTGPWAKAWSVNPEYTHLLSLHQHNIIRSATKDHFGAASIAQLAEGRAILADRIRESVQEVTSALSMSRLARLMGIGSDVLTDRVLVDGSLRPENSSTREPVSPLKSATVPMVKPAEPISHAATRLLPAPTIDAADDDLEDFEADLSLGKGV